MDASDFQLPDEAGADLVAVAQIAVSLARLTAAVDALHQQHLQLRDAITHQQNTGPRRAPPGLPWPLRWSDMDRDSAALAWAWLIDWVGWAVNRYQLAEEIPACWHQHPPLIDELTALAAAWQSAYDDTAAADAPLLWLERLARVRARIRDWDDYTRCRNGTHTDRHLDLDWPADWRDNAVHTANTDLTTHPTTNTTVDQMADARQPS